MGRSRIEVPDRALAYREAADLAAALGRQQFTRTQAVQFGLQFGGAIRFLGIVVVSAIRALPSVMMPHRLQAQAHT